MRTRILSSLFLAALALAGCDSDPVVVDDRGGTGAAPGRPLDVNARYEWILDGWSGSRPVGHPSVLVTWKLPTSWDGRDPFRVYGRRAGQTTYALVATVTSCERGECRYLDINVAPGTRYEYYVATVDESSGQEAASQFRVGVDVPAATAPATPQPDSAVGLDNAVYLRWKAAGQTGAFWKYRVYLVGIDAAAHLYQLGEADAPGFVDLRARNGHVYRYRVAAVDTLGHVSDLSVPMSAVPRPDFRGELLYAYGDSTAASGFRFVSTDSLSPLVSGDSPSAQWRFEVVNGTWQIRPLGDTEVADVGRTTALTCGPGADAGCRAATRAPTSGYSRAPVPLFAEVSYVFRVRGADGRVRHGVIRPQLLGSDQRGRRLVILDWAYQLIADEPRLYRGG